jgi:hypothetical protein
MFQSARNRGDLNEVAGLIFKFQSIESTSAQPGNQTLVSTMGGYYDTTTPVAHRLAHNRNAPSVEHPHPLHVDTIRGIPTFIF